MPNRIAFLVAAAMIASAAGARAQQPPPEKLETQKLAEGLWVISGAGGNVTVTSGPGGVLIIDDKLAPATGELKKAIAALTPKPVRFVFNTHWHGDHTGGNPVFGGEGAVIVAQDNVRKRLSTKQFVARMNKEIPAAPEAALPVITFTDSMAFHLNGDDLEIMHVDPAHTDGDSIIHFKKANVIVMGDTYFSSGYPFIDTSSGGNVDGYVKAADRVLAIAQPTTKIVPGHGPVTDREKLRVFRDMLATLRDRIKKLAAAGKTLAEVQAAKPSADYDATWGKAFIGGPAFVETIYTEVAKKR